MLFYPVVDSIAAAPTTSERLAESDHLINRGIYKDAEVILGEILAIEPNNSAAIYQSGVIAVREGRLDDGQIWIRRAIELEPLRVEFRVALASVYQFKGLFTEALQEYQQIMLLAAKDDVFYKLARKESRYIIATENAKKGDYATAAELFTWLVDEYPDDIRSRYSLGVAKLYLGKIDEAIIDFNAVIDLSPDYVDVYFALADVYYKTGRIPDSVETMQRLLNRGDKVPSEAKQRAQIKINLTEAAAILEQGNAEDALAIFKAVLLIDPANQVAAIGKGRAEIELKEYDAAIITLGKVIDRYGKDPAAQYYYAIAQIRRGNMDEGIQKLYVMKDDITQGRYGEMAQHEIDVLARDPRYRERISEQMINIARERLASDPHDASARKILADDYARKGDLVNARMEYDQLLAGDENNLLFRVMLGQLNEGLGDYGQAIDHYARAVALTMDSSLAEQGGRMLLLTAARRMYQEKNYTQALELATRARGLDPGNPDILFMLGMIDIQLGRTKEAIDELSMLLQMAPEHVGARINLAFSLEQIGREEDALIEYQNLLKQKELGDEYRMMVVDRVDVVERMLMGLSGSFSYSLGVTDNVSLSKHKESDLRSDLAFNMGYNYKDENGVKWRMALSPSYTSYHVGQYDYFNSVSSLSAATSEWYGFKFNAGLTHNLSRGVLDQHSLMESVSASLGGQRSLYLPVVYNPTGLKKGLATVSINLARTDSENIATPALSAYVTAINLSLNQSVGSSDSIEASYDYSISDNKYNQGTDYANTSYGITLGIEHAFQAGIVGKAGYSYAKILYGYPDSYTKYKQYRTNDHHGLDLSGSYSFRGRLRFYVNLSLVINQSDLPVGFSLSPQNVIQGQQSFSLGSYNATTLSTGMVMGF
ncbi:MAG: tetratricopeptide repeat protein [Gammaproteobacteria bacterium]|nr:tetratricopeptide repeat protein [Gammaproteobacteria bacterium]